MSELRSGSQNKHCNKTRVCICIKIWSKMVKEIFLAIRIDMSNFSFWWSDNSYNKITSELCYDSVTHLRCCSVVIVIVGATVSFRVDVLCNVLCSSFCPGFLWFWLPVCTSLYICSCICTFPDHRCNRFSHCAERPLEECGKEGKLGQGLLRMV